jgi:uncharacterized protein (DUF983 family)
MKQSNTLDQQTSVTFQRILLHAWRGWTKACPRCGARGLFEQWFTLRPCCPNCGLRFEREEGYWVGAMGANIIVTELIFAVLLIFTFVVTWPDPPVREMIIGAVLFTIAFPIFFYPFSKSIWMAFDRAFNLKDQPFDNDIES